MNVSIVSVFPDLYTSFISTSLIGKAREKKILTLNLGNFFSFVQPKERIDAPSFGHSAGMIIRPEVVERAVEYYEREYGPALKIFFSPHGTLLNQNVLKKLAQKMLFKKHLLLLPARYEGMDARVEQEYADEVISVGNFVLMGGDIPAMMTLEGILRLIPGIVGNSESVEQDSFSKALVDYPEYCAPAQWKGYQVPEVLRSGNHAAIQTWRTNAAVQRTTHYNFDWFRSSHSTKEERSLIARSIPSHYVALMHTQVLTKSHSEEGTTSVTSIDIHDIARSAKTYGIKNFFIVTPLIDQQKIVATLLDFWQKGIGVEYNKSRHEAVRQVILISSLSATIEAIDKIEGCKPLIIATSARSIENIKMLTYFDQSIVWRQERPVLILLGTGQGLSPRILEISDYVLYPLVGLSDFNHLSVRSAAAIIFDRWLGINQKVA